MTSTHTTSSRAAYPNWRGALPRYFPPGWKSRPLAGFWHTEAGPLNQIVHVWPYKDAAEREEARREMKARNVWGDLGDFVINMQSDVYLPAPFTRPLEPADLWASLRDQDVHLHVRRDRTGHGRLGRRHRGAREVLAACRSVLLRLWCDEQVDTHLGIPELRAAHDGARRDARPWESGLPPALSFRCTRRAGYSYQPSSRHSSSHLLLPLARGDFPLVVAAGFIFCPARRPLHVPFSLRVRVKRSFLQAI